MPKLIHNFKTNSELEQATRPNPEEMMKKEEGICCVLACLISSQMHVVLFN
jgi:hypothetical protein